VYFFNSKELMINREKTLKFCGLFDDVEIDVFYEKKNRIRKKDILSSKPKVGSMMINVIIVKIRQKWKEPCNYHEMYLFVVEFLTKNIEYC